MSENRVLTCPSCGGSLDHPPAGVDHVRCPFCKNTVLLAKPLSEEQPESRAPSTEDLKEVIRFGRAGKMTEATKLYSKIFSLRMEDAFEDVDKLMSGQVVYIAGYRIMLDGDIQEMEMSPLREFDPHWEPEDVPELARLVREGLRMEAIILLRRMFPIGIKEADGIVEKLADGKRVMISDMIITPDGHYTSKADLPERFASLVGMPEELAELAHLIETGDLPGAVKLYRKIYEIGQAEAQKAVERLAQ